MWPRSSRSLSRAIALCTLEIVSQSWGNCYGRTVGTSSRCLSIVAIWSGRYLKSCSGEISSRKLNTFVRTAALLLLGLDLDIRIPPSSSNPILTRISDTIVEVAGSMQIIPGILERLNPRICLPGPVCRDITNRAAQGDGTSDRSSRASRRVSW